MLRELLFYACLKGRWQDVEDALRAGADVGWTADDGHTALHYACMRKNADVARQLLTNVHYRARVDINALSSNGTPLHLACRPGRRDIALVLIEKGADIMAFDEHRNTPLHMASYARQASVIRRMLTSRYVDIDVQNVYRDTPLIMACAAVSLPVIQMLLDANADVNHRNREGMSALYSSIQACPFSVVSMILNRNPNVELADNNNVTPLHLACKMGRADVVKALLNGVVDVNVRDKWGFSPLDMAASTGSLEIIEMLLQAGAVVSKIIHGRGGGSDCLTDGSRTTLGRILQVLFTRNFNISVASQCLEDVCQNAIIDQAIYMFNDCFFKTMTARGLFGIVHTELTDKLGSGIALFFQSVKPKAESFSSTPRRKVPWVTEYRKERRKMSLS